MAGNKFAGTCYVAAGERQLVVAGEVSHNLGQRATRETQTGLNGPVGFSEQLTTPFVEVEVMDAGDDLEALADLEDGTITVENANGRVGVLANAWQVNDVTKTASNGRATLRFEGLRSDRT